MTPLEAIAEKLSSGPVGAVTQVLGGGNNRLFRVEGAGGATYALKTYHAKDDDGAVRREAEYGGLRFLWSHGVRVVPRPVAQDAKNGCVLFDWVAGSAVCEPGAREIEATLDFAARLLDLSRQPDAQGLPLAREACLSAAELTRQIRVRRERLENEAVFHEDLQTFLLGGFDLAVVEVVEAARKRYRAGGTDFAAEISPEARTLSSSDFGFHNALRAADGAVVFLDFEYFGWDDPVKLVADFLLHPGMNLSAELRSQFREGANTVFAGDAGFAERLAVLYPLYALRWALIALNEFLPEVWGRRRFARGAQSHDTVLKAQLAKAAALIRRSREVPAHAA